MMGIRKLYLPPGIDAANRPAEQARSRRIVSCSSGASWSGSSGVFEQGLKELYP